MLFLVYLVSVFVIKRALSPILPLIALIDLLYEGLTLLAIVHIVIFSLGLLTPVSRGFYP